MSRRVKSIDNIVKLHVRPAVSDYATLYTAGNNIHGSVNAGDLVYIIRTRTYTNGPMMRSHDKSYRIMAQIIAKPYNELQIFWVDAAATRAITRSASPLNKFAPGSLLSWNTKNSQFGLRPYISSAISPFSKVREITFRLRNDDGNCDMIEEDHIALMCTGSYRLSWQVLYQGEQCDMSMHYTGLFQEHKVAEHV